MIGKQSFQANVTKDCKMTKISITHLMLLQSIFPSKSDNEIDISNIENDDRSEFFDKKVKISLKNNSLQISYISYKKLVSFEKNFLLKQYQRITTSNKLKRSERNFLCIIYINR